MHGKHLFGFLATPLADQRVLPALINDRQLVDGRSDFAGAVELLLKGIAAAGLGFHDFLAWQRDRSPYPGFSAFEEADAGVFFGRDRESERGLAMVRGGVQGTASRLSLLLGSSGSGKSSLLRAGIVPLLRLQNDLILVGPFQPGPEPLAELALQIAAAFGVEADKLPVDLRHPPQDGGLSLDRLVRQLLQEVFPRRRHALFLIDQFEELLGRPPDHPSHPFLSLFQSSLHDPEGCLSVLATLRSDQLGRLQNHPATKTLDWQSLFVSPLDAVALRVIIEEPARLAELKLEAGFADLLIADTTSPEALPLLALTLRRLWERYGDDALLQVKEYRQLGRIHEVVARVADDALGENTSEEKLGPLRKALLKMVRLDEYGNAVRQPLLWQDTPADARPLLDRFVKSRLLVHDQDKIQVVHDALFTAWGRLSVWIDEHRKALVDQQRLSQAARLWLESQDKNDLWRGARLDRGLELDATGELELGETERRFLAASQAVRNEALAEKNRREREREKLSRVALGRGLAYQSLGEAQSRPQRGLLLAVEAVRTTWEHGFGVTAVAETALHELLSSIGGKAIGSFGARVDCLGFDPRGRWLAVGCEDGTVGLLSLQEPEAGTDSDWRTRPSASAIVDLAIGERWLLARSDDGVVRIWEIADSGEVNDFREFRPTVAPDKIAVAFGSGGQLLAIAEEGQDLLLHDLKAGTHQPLWVEGAPTRVLSFSPDSRWLLEGREDGRVVLWDLTTIADQPRAILVDAHPVAVKRVAWAPLARCFVTVGMDNNLRRWTFGQTPGQIELTELASSGSSILDLAVSPGGDLVAAGTWHAETLCWLADDGFAQPLVLKGHSSSICSVAIRDDGLFLLTASSRDNFALLWPVGALRRNPAPYTVRGEDRWLQVIRFAPDGALVAGSWAGEVRRWYSLTEEPREVAVPGVDLNDYVLSRDGSRLLSAGANASIGGEPDRRGKLVNVNSGRVEPIDEPPVALAVAMTPDGRLIIIGSDDGTISVRDGMTGGEKRFSFPLEGWFSSLNRRSNRPLVGGNQPGRRPALRSGGGSRRDRD